jgi:hypothetical protein
METPERMPVPPLVIPTFWDVGSGPPTNAVNDVEELESTIVGAVAAGETVSTTVTERGEFVTPEELELTETVAV